MKSQPLKNGMTPLIQLRRSWWTITTCLREVIYWKGSTKSNSQTLTCYCSEWRRTPSGFYFGTAQAEWFWGWLDVSQLHFLFIPKTFLCLLHTPFGIRSPKVLVVVSAWTELVLDLTNFTSGGSNAGVRILKASTPMPFTGDDTNLGGWSLGVPLTWQVFKFTRLLQGLRSLRIIRFIGGLRVLVYSMFLDEFWSKMTGARGWFKSVLGNMCFVWMFLGTPKYRWSHVNVSIFGQQKRVETNYSLKLGLTKSLPCNSERLWRDKTTASNCSIWKDTGEIRTAHKHLVLIHQDPVIYGRNIVIGS